MAIVDPQAMKFGIQPPRNNVQQALQFAPEGMDTSDPILRRMLRQYFRQGGAKPPSDIETGFARGALSNEFQQGVGGVFDAFQNRSPDVNLMFPEPASNPAGDAAAAALRQQAAQLAAQAEAERQAQIQALQAQLNDIVSERSLGVQGLRSDLERVNLEEEFQTGERERQQVFDEAALRENVAGRGLSRSGIRLGAENRAEDALLRALADIGRRAGQGREDINRAIEELQSRSRTQIGSLEGQIRGLGG